MREDLSMKWICPHHSLRSSFEFHALEMSELLFQPSESHMSYKGGNTCGMFQPAVCFNRMNHTCHMSHVTCGRCDAIFIRNAISRRSLITEDLPLKSSASKSLLKAVEQAALLLIYTVQGSKHLKLVIIHT